ncbi:MAG: Gfo/Idh/MocA family oxidoreductase [Clostridia bacterium]|nr:Gfo/Idh/MocA family oxidoreductase [Clostridia bacterium]
MKRLKVAQIGIGHDHAVPTFDSCLRQSELFEMAAYAPGIGEEDRTPHDTFTKNGVPRMTPEELLEIPGLDAVIVETDDWHLTEYALAAVKKGLPVHMDKPGTPSQEEFDELCRAAINGNVPLQLGYMYRYNPMIIDLMQQIKNGELGEIFCVEAHMDCEHVANKRQWLDHFKGGMMYFLGCHLVDLIVQICGVPEEVIPMNAVIGHEGVTAEDFGMASFRYKNGYSFAKTCALEYGGFLRRQLVVCGTKKTVELRPLEQAVENGLQITRSRVCTPGKGWNTDGVYDKSEAVNRYDSMMADFAAMARGEKTNPVSLEYEAQLHRIILAACGEKIDYTKKLEL